MKNFFLLGVCLFFFYSCINDTSLNKIDKDDFERDSLIRITNWYALLPFRPDTLLPVLERENQDFLIQFGKSENQIKNIQDFISIQPVDSLKFGSIEVLKHIFDLALIEKLTPPMSCYLATTIQCNKQLSAVIAMSAYQSCKIWVNGDLIGTTDWKRGRSEYREDFIPVRLKRGNNFVMLKVTVSDTDYQPAQWKFEVDIANLLYAKKLYNSEFRRYFIKKSLLSSGDSLKLYAGPYEKLHVIISNTHQEFINKEFNINSFNRSLSIDVTNLSEGLYQCKITVDSILLAQDFYYGDFDKYYREKYTQYRKMGTYLNEVEQSNFEGLFKRLYILGRRKKDDFDHLCEYWNRLRIPTMKMLNHALMHPEDVHSYFIHTYKSEYLKKLHHYSAYVPVTNLKSLPVFIILYSQEMEVNDWTDHWRNFVADGLDQIMDLANDIGFIPVWTDCGGGKNPDRQLTVFNEIYENVVSSLPADMNRVFVIGICESTSISLLLLQHYPTKIKGCGFVDPINFESPYFAQTNNNHKLCMLYSFHDEVIPNESSLAFYRKLISKNNKTILFTDYHSTHYNCMKNYFKPVFTYMIDDTFEY
jgi:hypothetical protein